MSKAVFLAVSYIAFVIAVYFGIYLDHVERLAGCVK